MIPDPVPVAPEITLPPEPERDAQRARELVAEGRALLRTGAHPDAAIERFLAAIESDSSHGPAYWHAGLAFQQLGRWNDVVEVWEALAQRDPGYPNLARHLPLARMRRDRAASRAALPAGTVLAPEEIPRPGPRLRIAAVGDIQLGRSWPEEEQLLPPDNGAVLFDRVDQYLRSPDITFGNLETVLADSGDSTKCRRRSRTCYAFRAPTRYAATLRDFGFDVLSINNNHAGDFGELARRATVTALDESGILHSGPPPSSGIASWETRGIRVALIAFSTGEGPYRVQDIPTARSLVVEADRGHDVVIVSFHGGAEGRGATHIPKAVERAFGENRGDVYRFSRALVDAGADLVLGHGPHVLRGMEVYRGRLIAYSLGNFSAWHGFNLRGPLGLSAVLHVTLAPNGVVTTAQLVPVFLESPGVPTPDPQGRAIEIVRSLSQEDLGDPLFDARGWYRRCESPPHPNPGRC